MNYLIDRIRYKNYLEANIIIKDISGIIDFFASDDEKDEFLTSNESFAQEACEGRASYGDWQTPEPLAEKVCEKHIERFGQPNIVIEPTCGLGAFVMAALKKFPEVAEIHALEINYRYTIELKHRLLLNALLCPNQRHPDIYIYNADFFEFDFTPVIERSKTCGMNIAIVGNPPWVTNSHQGKHNSGNLPAKNNTYKLRGIEAITGRSNFDISEYITLELLKLSQDRKGGMSFLLKNSVVRNILQKQRNENLHIGKFEQQLIDAAAEFNVSVDASCLSVNFDSVPSYSCRITDFYSGTFLREYGWIGDCFVSDTQLYKKFSKYDNVSTYVWRSGIKHDCSSVLELTMSAGSYFNGLGERVEIESDMIFPLLKSSDINHYKENQFRKFLVITNRKVGEDTSVLRNTHPLTYKYLISHETDFLNRKSSIYKGKDKFSIFGVGDYSFKPFKIVVSSLYKTINFKIISQYGGKPVMVDDTCYQLDFDNLEEAERIYEILTGNEIQSLLQSLIFKDAKRVVTKSLLMRLDLTKLCREKGIAIPSQRFVDSQYRQLSLFN